MLLSSRSKLLVLCVVACGCGREAAVAPASTLRPLTTIREVARAGEAPLLQLPIYLRTRDGQQFWTLDTKRKSAVALDWSGAGGVRAGRPGRGPGEISVALAMDLAGDGTVWIADVGNGKVAGFREGRIAHEFMLEHQPLGIVAAADGTLWVGGDLRRSVLRRYDRAGTPLGSAGVPLDTTGDRYRFNQGVAAPGAGPCAVVWAYTFYSIVECYAPDGRTAWRGRPPTSIQPRRGANPFQMSPDDRFAYVDVTAAGGRVYGLFVGGPPTEDGLRTREVHVFDARDGSFLQAMQLPEPAKYIARYDTLLATIDYDPEPLIRVYRVEGEDR